LRHAYVELRFVITRVLIFYEDQLFERFFIIAGLEIDAAKFENRRDIFVLSLLGVFFDRAIKKSYPSIAVARERAFDEIFECADRRLE
jgi:hypothetical protein